VTVHSRAIWKIVKLMCNDLWYTHISRSRLFFKHAAGQDIFLLRWRQVLSYDVSLLNIRLTVNSVIDLVQFSYNLK
jgi:hypothetical protein